MSSRAFVGYALCHHDSSLILVFHSICRYLSAFFALPYCICGLHSQPFLYIRVWIFWRELITIICVNKLSFQTRIVVLSILVFVFCEILDIAFIPLFAAVRISNARMKCKQKTLLCARIRFDANNLFNCTPYDDAFLRQTY